MCWAMDVPAHINDVTRQVIGAAIEVHSVIGPGVFEKIYGQSLKRELTDRGLRFESERMLPAIYKGHALDASYRLDLIVEDVVIVEVKAIETILPIHEAQLVTYLRLAALPVGLLINFNVPRLTDGIRRKANTKPRRHSAMSAFSAFKSSRG
jgi:GxxExxY protein